jgi:undecaprenyl-diphosphatase
VSRRHDLRFRVVPFDGPQTANAVALIASALLVLAFVLDPLLVAWQDALPAGAQHAFKTVTRFGKSDWILVTTGLFVIAMLALDASAMHQRLRVRRAVRTLAALYVFLSVAASGILVNLAKYGIGRARPKHFADAGPFAFHPFSGDAGWASFPSGHSTTAMALGVALALLFPRFRWVFVTLGFWIAVSRLGTRAHYPSDVLAGCLAGGLTAWLFARALARRRLVFGFDGAGRLVRRRGASGRLF